MSYETEHPTNFNWVPEVRERVTTIQRRHPWKTYVNTYWDHPPDLRRPRRWPAGYYDPYSLDVWGGGGTNQGNYSGYRGKPLPKDLGNRIFHELFHAASGPAIDWIIWRGRMWWNPKTGGPGWTDAPRARRTPIPITCTTSIAPMSIKEERRARRPEARRWAGFRLRGRGFLVQLRCCESQPFDTRRRNVEYIVAAFQRLMGSTMPLASACRRA